MNGWNITIMDDNHGTCPAGTTPTIQNQPI